ncbi:MAG: Mur ligase family protein, partial [Thermoanaerobaculia bacterium]
MELISVLPGAELSPGGADPEIRRVVADSRRVGPGDLFVAIRGEKSDGLAFVPDALSRGAAAVLAQAPAPEAVPVPWVRVENARKALGRAATRLAGNPAEKLHLAGVTGTNGKTTTALLLQSLLRVRYGEAGFVGTVGYRIGRRELPAERTTPDAALLQELLAEMVRAGIPAASMEVSSHALALDRVEGCRFDLAVFTNLTRDHLDFHRDMESYYGAKRSLFELRKPDGAAVVNVGEDYGRRLAGEIGGRVWTYCAGEGGADLTALSARCDLSGPSFEAVSPVGRFRVSSRLLGRFNVDNLLAAAAGG